MKRRSSSLHESNPKKQKVVVDEESFSHGQNSDSDQEFGSSSTLEDQEYEFSNDQDSGSCSDSDPILSDSLITAVQLFHYRSKNQEITQQLLDDGKKLYAKVSNHKKMRSIIAATLEEAKQTFTSNKNVTCDICHCTLKKKSLKSHLHSETHKDNLEYEAWKALIDLESESDDNLCESLWTKYEEIYHLDQEEEEIQSSDDDTHFSDVAQGTQLRAFFQFICF